MRVSLNWLKQYIPDFKPESIDSLAEKMITIGLDIESLEDTGKIRYNDFGHDALIEQIHDDQINVKFNSPQKAITPGQSAVFYDGEHVIGGGIIDKIIN